MRSAQVQDDIYGVKWSPCWIVVAVPCPWFCAVIDNRTIVASISPDGIMTHNETVVPDMHIAQLF